ncbi:helix-turn-helix transcriptional regulator [Enterobacter hormaechei]
MPKESVFIVICSEYTMHIIKGLPGYDKALLINASDSVHEFLSKITDRLAKIRKRLILNEWRKRQAPLYKPDFKDMSLIAAMLRLGEINKIARIERVSPKTLHSRLGKIYQKLDVKNRMDLIMKVQILFDYGYWEKSTFDRIYNVLYE